MSESLHPIYLQAVNRRLSQITQEGVVSESEESLRLEAQTDKIALSILVDSRGKVLLARHQGAQGAARGILDLLCELSVNRPLREVSEHGLVYVEFALRDPAQKHFIEGLVTPENAGEPFHAPLKLVRDLYRQWLAANGPEKQKNFWTPKAPEHWLALSDLKQFKAVQEGLVKILGELQIDATNIEIVQILNATRVVISLKDRTLGEKFGSSMIKIETTLNQRLGVDLELLLESVEDRNKRLDRTTISRTTPTASL